MINTIIFDWGGVLAPSDNKTAAALLKDKYDIDADKFIQFCKENEGKYGDTNKDGEYVKAVSNEFSVPEDEVMDALNASPPNEAYFFAKDLSESYDLYLLSNQVKFRTDYIRKNFDISFFKETYFSNEIALKKPNKKIFYYVLKEIKRKAKNCVFIDDNKDNIETAKKMGFNVALFTSLPELYEELRELKVSV